MGRRLGIGVGDLVTAAAEAQGASVDLIEEGLRPIAEPVHDPLSLGELPRPLLAPAEVVLPQALLLGAGTAVALGFFGKSPAQVVTVEKRSTLEVLARLA